MKKWNLFDKDENFLGCFEADNASDAVVLGKDFYPGAVRAEENTQEDHAGRGR